MELSNEIKEDIRKTQTDLKNAIRVHQAWIARLQDDENNLFFKSKVKEAERNIIQIGQAQKLVVEKLRRELELYQVRLKSRNKQVNIENEAHYVAQQIKEHQILHHRNRNRFMSLLKPSVLNEIQIKADLHRDDTKENNISDSDSDTKCQSGINSNHRPIDGKYERNYSHSAAMYDSRSNFANALNKVIGVKICSDRNDESRSERNVDWSQDRQEPGLESQRRSDTGSPHSPALDAPIPEPSLSPSPPPMPVPGEPFTQEMFLRIVGLVTHTQKDILDKKRSERRKRAVTSTNKTDFLYGSYDMMPKRKKYNQYPYLQTHSDPPQTRSAKLRKQQFQSSSPNNKSSSREGSPSGSSGDNNEKPEWRRNKPAWAASLPASLSVEPVYSSKKVCHECGKSDVPSLLVQCSSCALYVHTRCAEGGACPRCGAHLPEPRAAADPRGAVSDKLAERKRLQERNIQLCIELRKLEARATHLKESLDEHNAEKRQLLADQIKTQRNLQKLLDFISQFKETSVSIRSTSFSETGSEISKSNED